ncbi:MAG: flagellar filament capping protein FliD [Nitrospinae bacterium]|nr:flagellar filament capping protein FliD [Nitrospinota bacterium]
MAEIGPVTFGGLTTGLDTKNLISELLRIARLPQQRLEKRQASANARIAAFKELNSKLLALSTALKKLETSTDFFVRTSTVSDATKLAASVTSAAAVGNTDITINTLATKGVFTFKGESSDTATGIVGAGTVTIANLTGSTTPFTSSISITTTASTTLRDLRDAINNSANNKDANNDSIVTATILDNGIVGDAKRFVLQITANKTGKANDFDLTETTSLAKEPTATTAAVDASLTVGGVTLTRSSNTVSDVLTGVTLTLKATGTATLTVSNDTTAMANNIKAVVSAFNDVRSFVASKSTLDQKNPQNNGPFVGDSTVRGVIDRLQTEVTRAVGGLSSDFNALNDIGITTDPKTGKLNVNDTTLSSALSANADQVSKIFLGSGGVSGVAALADTDLAKDTNPGGLIDVRVGGIQKQVTALGDQIEREARRLKSFEALLVRQFAALERLASVFQSQGIALGGLTPQQTTTGRTKPLA